MPLLEGAFFIIGTNSFNKPQKANMEANIHGQERPKSTYLFIIRI